MTQKDRLSANDLRILAALQRDGRASYSDLGAAAGMSAPSAHERVKRLESRGIVRGYAAVVDPQAVGLGVLAFSRIRQAPGMPSTDLTTDFARIPEVEDCHHVAGEADYLLKVRATDTLDLERVMRLIQAIPHVYTSETEIVFSTAFERRALPLDRETGSEPQA
ncbi:MAG: Lrp/AsnC family transcriptional regulator [Chloroflexota bacterium]|nr:Lrp/AsnC family transcriptional regulator [Chloroflexota bacterium]